MLLIIRLVFSVFFFFFFLFFSVSLLIRWSLALYLLPYLPPLSVVPHFTFLLLLSIRLFDSLTCSLFPVTSFSFSYLCSLSRPSSPFFLSTSLVSLSLFICFSPHALLPSSTFLSVSLFLSVISLRFFLISPQDCSSSRSLSISHSLFLLVLSLFLIFKTKKEKKNFSAGARVYALKPRFRFFPFFYRL